MSVSNRVLGIRARVKQTKDGEARPTQICMALPKGKPKLINLKDDQDELYFISGKLPVKWRDVEPNEDLSETSVRHIKWEPISLDADTSSIHGTHLNNEGKQRVQATKVASEFDGLSQGDTIVMGLGFGDELAFALARMGGTFAIPATVQRVPPIILHDYRESNLVNDPELKTKDQDAKLLTELWLQSPEKFYPVKNRDEQIIELRLKYKQWIEAQKARVACEQRLIKRLRTEMYLGDPKLYPEGSLEKFFQEQKASDVILKGLIQEEKRRLSELGKIVSSIDVFTEVFNSVEGCGVSLAARLISAIQDVRRFSTKHKLKAYCGVHVRNGGKYADVLPEKQFVRRRGGETANWHDDARKALYLFVEQANKRPDSVWGQKLRKNKENWAARHLEASKMHVHRTGMWRTASQFVEYIFDEWMKLEVGEKASSATA